MEVISGILGEKVDFLHYDEAKDVAYYHVCVTAFKQKKITESRADPVFVSQHVFCDT